MRPKQDRRSGEKISEADKQKHLNWWKLPGTLILMGISHRNKCPRSRYHAVVAELSHAKCSSAPCTSCSHWWYRTGADVQA